MLIVRKKRVDSDFNHDGEEGKSRGNNRDGKSDGGINRSKGEGNAVHNKRGKRGVYGRKSFESYGGFPLVGLRSNLGGTSIRLGLFVLLGQQVSRSLKFINRSILLDQRLIYWPINSIRWQID